METSAFDYKIASDVPPLFRYVNQTLNQNLTCYIVGLHIYFYDFHGEVYTHAARAMLAT